MNNNQLTIKKNISSVRDAARLLMSVNRQKQQNRQQSMLYRAVEEIGINE